MKKKDKILSIEKLIAEITEFRQQQKTLILATYSNQPLASYAPFIDDETGNFYLFLSGLATHSGNLQQHLSEQNLMSVLLIEDEQTSRNLFARRRLTYHCEVSIWPREHPQWKSRIESFREKFGKTIDVLAALGDFSLYCLTPKQGSYVRGFGQAYELENAKIPVLPNQ